MRPDEEYFEDLDFIDEFAYGKSRALRKLLEEHRREERREAHQRSPRKKRHQPESWDWDDEDDYDSYVDDNFGQYHEDRNGGY